MRQVASSELFKSLHSLVRKAGEAIMQVYVKHDHGVAAKTDASPVTEADHAAHLCLVEGLKMLLPDCPVVSEEDETSWCHRRSEGRFWLVDPLDGTKEFIARNGEFTVNVALIEDGRSVLGVVYSPVLNSLYWGGENYGAWRQQDKEVTVLRVNNELQPAVCRVTASKSHLNEQTRAFIDRLGCVQLVRAGSSLKFCRVAEGKADIYPRLSPTCEWDTGAAQAVLEGAGGCVVDLAGVPLQYGKPEVLNPFFVAARDVALICHD